MLLQILINGLLKGGLYALMAIGMSLIWGVMDIINIAHGSFIMLGAFVTYWLFTLLGIDPFLSLFFSVGLLFILGYGIQRYLINYVIRASAFITLILAFGIEIFINNLALVAWTADVRKVEVAYGAANFSIGHWVTIPPYGWWPSVWSSSSAPVFLHSQPDPSGALDSRHIPGS